MSSTRRRRPPPIDEPSFLPPSVARAADSAVTEVLEEDRKLRRLGLGLAGNDPAEL